MDITYFKRRLSMARNHRVGMLAMGLLLLWATSAHALDLSTTTVQDLARNRSCLMVIDARSPDLYTAAHIPGAGNFYWENHTRPRDNALPFALDPPEQLAAALTQMGIHQNSPVVIYGQGKSGYGGEGWAAWVLAYLGHKGPIRILKGGLDAWQAKTLPLSTPQSPVPPPEPTGPRLTLAYQYALDSDILARTRDMDANTHPLIDTRSFFERLTQPTLAGATNIHWQKFFDDDGYSPLPPDRLDALLRSHGIPYDVPVVYFCTGGIRSSWAWLVHTLARPGKAMNFEAGTASLDRN